MIVPNLMVADLEASIAFYRDIIGMRFMMALADGERMIGEGELAKGVFATLELGGAQLMLQTRSHFEGALPGVGVAERPAFTGTIYFREASPLDVAGRVDAAMKVREVETSWYGMRELYLRDPDGYLVCIADRDPDFSMSGA